MKPAWERHGKEMMTQLGWGQEGNMRMKEAYHESFDANSRRD
jgi:hypothetical protein